MCIKVLNIVSSENIAHKIRELQNRFTGSCYTKMFAHHGAGQSSTKKSDFWERFCSSKYTSIEIRECHPWMFESRMTKCLYWQWQGSVCRLLSICGIFSNPPSAQGFSKLASLVLGKIPVGWGSLLLLGFLQLDLLLSVKQTRGLCWGAATYTCEERTALSAYSARPFSAGVELQHATLGFNRVQVEAPARSCLLASSCC